MLLAYLIDKEGERYFFLVKTSCLTPNNWSASGGTAGTAGWGEWGKSVKSFFNSFNRRTLIWWRIFVKDAVLANEWLL